MGSGAMPAPFSVDLKELHLMLLRRPRRRLLDLPGSGREEHNMSIAKNLGVDDIHGPSTVGDGRGLGLLTTD